MLYALLITASLVAITTTVWYFTTPIGDLSISISGSLINNTANLDTSDLAHVNQTFNLMTFCLRLWGPLLDCVYVVWFLIFGTRADTESELRRGRVYYG